MPKKDDNKRNPVEPLIDLLAESGVSTLIDSRGPYYGGDNTPLAYDNLVISLAQHGVEVKRASITNSELLIGQHKITKLTLGNFTRDSWTAASKVKKEDARTEASKAMLERARHGNSSGDDDSDGEGGGRGGRGEKKKKRNIPRDSDCRFPDGAPLCIFVHSRGYGEVTSTFHIFPAHCMQRQNTKKNDDNDGDDDKKTKINDGSLASYVVTIDQEAHTYHVFQDGNIAEHRGGSHQSWKLDQQFA